MSAHAIFTCILVACLFLQRFGLQFDAQGMNIVGPIGLGLGAWGLASGTLSLDRRRLALYLFLVMWVAIGVAVHAAWPPAYGVVPSMPSAIQYLVLTSFLTLTFTERMDERVFFHGVNVLFGLVAAAGILQFLAQLVGIRVFSFSGILPAAILIEFGFNVEIQSGIGSLLKANGFFLVEPSVFSQIMALGLIVNLLAFRQAGYICLFVAGLLLSFSGTGWIMLAAFVLGTGASMGLRGLMLAAMMLALLGLVLAVVLFLSPDVATMLNGRAGEVFVPGTSGHMRFVTPFWVMSDVVQHIPMVPYLGLGAGTSERLAMPYEYTVNTPVKIALEFGVPALAAYILLFVIADRTPLQRAIAPPAIVMMLFTGSYAQFPPVLFLVALIVCMARLRSEPVRQAGMNEVLGSQRAFSHVQEAGPDARLLRPGAV